MFKNYYRSFIYTMGLVSIIFIIVSLVWLDISIRHLYLMVGVTIPTHLFTYLTFELKLFSENIWIRRTVVIIFSLLVMFVSGYIFGSLRWKFKSVIIYCVIALLCVIVSVFAYYVADKIEQRNLKLINQKLGEENTSSIE